MEEGECVHRERRWIGVGGGRGEEQVLRENSARLVG